MQKSFTGRLFDALIFEVFMLNTLNQIINQNNLLDESVLRIPYLNT